MVRCVVVCSILGCLAATGLAAPVVEGSGRSAPGADERPAPAGPLAKADLERREPAESKSAWGASDVLSLAAFLVSIFALYQTHTQTKIALGQNKIAQGQLEVMRSQELAALALTFDEPEGWPARLRVPGDPPFVVRLTCKLTNDSKGQAFLTHFFLSVSVVARAASGDPVDQRSRSLVSSARPLPPDSSWVATEETAISSRHYKAMVSEGACFAASGVYAYRDALGAVHSAEFCEHWGVAPGSTRLVRLAAGAATDA